MKSKLYLIILFSFLPLFCYGRTLQVESFKELSNDNSALVSPRIDFNGDTCALIKVNSTIDELHFIGTVGDVKTIDGQYWVYVSPGTRKLELKKGDMETLEIKFNEISDISKVQSGKVYLLDVNIIQGKGLSIESLLSETHNLTIDTIIKLPTDITARRKEIRDVNNERCALLRINLPIPNCKFEGNTGEIEYDINEYHVYISPSQSNLTIKCPGTSMLIVDMNKVEPATTYKIKISGYDTSLVSISPELLEVTQKYDDISEFTSQFALAYKGDKMGIINIFGEEIIPCIYDAKYNYIIGKTWYLEYDNHVLFQLKKNNKYGLLDTQGNEVIPFEYEWLQKNVENKDDVRNRFVKVRKDGKHGVFDFNGKNIVPCLYDRIFIENDNIISVINDEENTHGIYNGDGVLVVPCKYSSKELIAKKGIIRLFENEKWRYIDNQGKQITERGFDEADGFYGGYAAVAIKGRGYGYINKKGEQVIPFSYSRCSSFTDGLAMVEKNRQWGAIDPSNNIVIPMSPYSYAYGFNEYGFAPVCKNKKWGVIDRTGEEILECIYDRVTDFTSFGLSNVQTVKKDEKVGVVDKEGNEIIPCIYKYIEQPYSYDKYFFAENEEGYWGVINERNEIVVPFIYDFICKADKETLKSVEVFSVKKNNKRGVIDTQGKPIGAVKYSWIYELKDGYMKVESSGKYGILSCMEKKEILPCIYDWVGIYDDGFLVSKDNKTWRATFDGEIIPSEYSCENFKDGLFKIKNKNGKSGYMDKEGHIIIPCEYDNAGYDSEEGIIKVEKDNKIGILNTKGEKITDCKYDYMENFSNGFAKVFIGNQKGFINIKGEELWLGSSSH